MSVRLIQYRSTEGGRAVAMLDSGSRAVRLDGFSTTYDLARAAIAAGQNLAGFAAALRSKEEIDLEALARDNRLMAPIDHPDPAHLFLTGTGLTHLGSAESRDTMHKAATAEALTDSMRMFNMGLEGGKPEPGEKGVQPEWFYKGDGSVIVATGAPLPMSGLCRGRRRRAGNCRNLHHRRCRKPVSPRASASPMNFPIM